MISDNTVHGDSIYLRELQNFFFEVLGMMSITHYGARGDGITDNYAYLQVAIDDAHRRGLNYLYVPYGRYIYTGELINIGNLVFIGNPHAHIVNIRTGVEINIEQFGAWGGSSTANVSKLSASIVLTDGTTGLTTGFYNTDLYGVYVNTETPQNQIIGPEEIFYYDADRNVIITPQAQYIYQGGAWVTNELSGGTAIELTSNVYLQDDGTLSPSLDDGWYYTKTYAVMKDPLDPAIVIDNYQLFYFDKTTSTLFTGGFQHYYSDANQWETAKNDFVESTLTDNPAKMPTSEAVYKALQNMRGGSGSCAITAYLSSNTSVSDGQTEKIEFDSYTAKGYKLTLSNGDVVIGPGVHNVLVSTNVLVGPALATSGVSVNIRKNNIPVAVATTAINMNNPISISDMLVSVTEGDTISTTIKSTGGNTSISGSVYGPTYLTVKLVGDNGSITTLDSDLVWVDGTPPTIGNGWHYTDEYVVKINDNIVVNTDSFFYADNTPGGLKMYAFNPISKDLFAHYSYNSGTDEWYAEVAKIVQEITNNPSQLDVPSAYAVAQYVSNH